VSKHLAAAAGLAVLAATPALAQTGASLSLAESRPSATFYGGYYAVTDGFSDRRFAGVFYNKYFGETGIHADVVGVDREEDSVFAALGVSWAATPTIRPKLTVGGSTANSNIHPEFYLSAQTQFRPSPGSPTILTPSLTYETFENGVELWTVGADAVRYFSLPSDQGGYYVFQGGAQYTPDPGGWSLGAGLQTIRANGVSFGGYVTGGQQVYDRFVGLDRETEFFSIRPTVGVRFTPEYEVFVRGEYTHTEFYDLTGAIVGLRVTF
jgi:hypothetical protein